MEESIDEFDKFLSALDSGNRIILTAEEFNYATEHVFSLIKDASTLLENGSHATAVFLSITAIEEIAKVHIGMYRKTENEISRYKDVLYKHKEKQNFGIGFTLHIGTRLPETIGLDRVNELITLARTGGLIDFREKSLYFERINNVLNIPNKEISKETSRELLLLAIEAFDDALVGYTNYSFELGKQTDALFKQWEKEIN